MGTRRRKTLTNQNKTMKQLASSELNDFPASYFYRAVSIYLRKAFVVNRKLSGVVNVVCLSLNPTKWNETVQETFIKKLRESQSGNLASEVENLLTTLGVSFVSRDHNDLDKIDDSEQEVFLCVDRMLPRNVTKFKAVHQLTLIGKSSTVIYLSTNRLPRPVRK